MDAEAGLGPCPLCGRPLIPGPSVNEHHLVPKSKKGSETVTLHVVCHGKIHSLFTENELRDHYHTIERLRAHPDMAAFLRWVARKPPEFRDGHRASARKKALKRRR